MPKKGHNKQSHHGRKEFGERLDDEPSRDDDDVDLQKSDRQYGRRHVQSNWGKYEAKPDVVTDGDAEGEIKSDDFQLLVNSSSDCNYFQFKSEKNWENEAVKSNFSGHKFFNLNLELLASGLGCIPFYDRIDIDKSILSPADIERCDKKAKEKQTQHKIISEKFLKELAHSYELPDVSLDAATKAVLGNEEDYVNEYNSVRTSEGVSVTCDKEKNELVLNQKQFHFNVTKSPTKEIEKITVFNSKEENLEDWLDSVLDD